ncbi:unnamed protein product [Cuscuta campestris]|uniref:Uncharacterized protein n=1 Tax=Cuscuta campestris TaxID=132261 RepID=A0A484KFM4_9ASTE|nr:unnamed protein product [Cuscuta campestris]
MLLIITVHEASINENRAKCIYKIHLILVDNDPPRRKKTVSGYDPIVPLDTRFHICVTQGLFVFKAKPNRSRKFKDATRCKFRARDLDFYHMIQWLEEKAGGIL